MPKISRVLILLLVLLAACSNPSDIPLRGSLGAVEAVNASDTSGYERVTAPRPFSFPQDHGPHQGYQTEWWYYTGNLQGSGGRHFGFQLTFFRRALSPEPPQRTSDFGARNIYMAHLALSDVEGGKFYAFDRFSRDGAGLAGANGVPYRVWLEDWHILSEGPQGMLMHLRAAQGDVALDLTLDNGTRPPVLQGDRGLSQKGSAPGNASYYYSLTHMVAGGTIGVGGQRYTVQGLAWMDHEFGTSSLDQNATGWDWFSIQLDDGREIMFFHIRQQDGSISPFSAGTLVKQDGETKPIAATQEEASLEVLGTWNSPHSHIEYPAKWRLKLPQLQLQLELTPYLADQELPLTVTYWEGAVEVVGTSLGQPVHGSGYVELTGYGNARGGREMMGE